MRSLRRRFGFDINGVILSIHVVNAVVGDEQLRLRFFATSAKSVLSVCTLAVIFLPLRFARGNAGGILSTRAAEYRSFGLFRDDVERGGIAADDNGLSVFFVVL